MANKKALACIQELVGADDPVRAAASVQLKTGSSSSRFAKDVVASTALSVAFSAVGVGVMRSTVPPQVWVVVTHRRLLMLRDSTFDLLFDAPLAAVLVHAMPGLFLNSLLVSDAANGRTAFACNFGLRAGALQKLVGAAQVRA